MNNHQTLSTTNAINSKGSIYHCINDLFHVTICDLRANYKAYKEVDDMVNV